MTPQVFSESNQFRKSIIFLILLHCTIYIHYKLYRVQWIKAKSKCSTLFKSSEVSEVLNTNLLKDSNINKNHVYITIYDTRKMFQVPEALFTIEKSTRIVFASSNMNSRENQFKPKNAEAHNILLHNVSAFKIYEVFLSETSF